jgi:hypothetical protein
MSSMSRSGLRRRLSLLGVAAVLAALSIAPVADAKPKPKLKASEYCEVVNGSQYYGIQVTGKHFPASKPINIYVRAYTPSGDQIPTEGGLLVADAKGRFSTYFKIGTVLESITLGAVSFLVHDVPVEATVERPCQ